MGTRPLKPAAPGGSGGSSGPSGSSGPGGSGILGGPGGPGSTAVAGIYRDLGNGDAGDEQGALARRGRRGRPASELGEWLGWALLASLLLATLIAACFFDRTGRPSLVGDEATYAMQAASLAWDFDLAYTRHDYDRFVAQWGGPPDGVILQSRDGGRHITYGKPALYALLVAPFVRLSPLRGALVANALLLAVAALLAARTLRLRTGPTAPFAVAVMVFASVCFAYVFWVHSDLFLLAAAAAGLAVAYGGDRPTSLRSLPEVPIGSSPGEPDTPEEPVGSVGSPLDPLDSRDSRDSRDSDTDIDPDPETERPPSRRWLWRWFLAGALLAVPGAFRPFYLVLLLPAALAVPAWRRRQGWSALAAGALALLLFSAALQRGAGGSWNGYTGQRLGFYARTGYPDVDFPATAWEGKLRQWGNTSWDQEGAFDPSGSPRLWGWNVLYFLAGRDVGVLPYFLPLLLGALAYRGDRGRWSIPLAVALAAGCFLLVRPFNFYGGGGAIGNRYFLPLYPALWFMAARRLRVAPVALVAILAAPFLWPLWRHPGAFPVGNDGRYRHVSEAARRLLPYETTQSHIPGGQDFEEHGVWVKLLSHDVWRRAAGQGGSADRRPLKMLATGEAEMLLGSPTPLPFLAVELDRRAPSRLKTGGVELRPSLLRANGWEVFEVPLRRPRVHPMWWTRDDYYLYTLTFRLPGGRPEPVGLRLGRGEDPAKIELEPALTPEPAGAAGGTGGAP